MTRVLRSLALLQPVNGRSAGQRVGGWICVLALGLGCGGGASDGKVTGRTPHGDSSVGGQVVSTVNGMPITLAEVNELVSGSGLDAKTALRRLQDERLLMGEAHRRGLEQEWAVAVVAQKAAVQALLSAEAGAVVVSGADIEAAYAQQRARFEKPERRSAVHLLARASESAAPSADAAARAVAQRLIPQLAATPADQLDALVRSQKHAVIDGVAIVAEHLPAVPQHGRLAQPFADAMFALPGPGTVPQPVRTPYGWHAIRLIEIVPAAQTPKAEAYATLGKELLLARQKQRVEELVARLRQSHPVQLSGSAARSLSALSF